MNTESHKYLPSLSIKKLQLRGRGNLLTAPESALYILGTLSLKVCQSLCCGRRPTTSTIMALNAYHLQRGGAPLHVLCTAPRQRADLFTPAGFTACNERLSVRVVNHSFQVLSKVLYRNTGILLGCNDRVQEWQGPGNKKKNKSLKFSWSERCTERQCVRERVLICCVGSREEGEHMRGGHGEVLGTDWWHQLSLREKTKPDSWSPVTATSAESATLDSYWVGGSITDTWHAQLHVSLVLIKAIKMLDHNKFWFITSLYALCISCLLNQQVQLNIFRKTVFIYLF